MASAPASWDVVPAPLVDLGQFDNAVALILDIARNQDLMVAQIRVRAVLEALLWSFEESACMHFQACNKLAAQRRTATEALRTRRDALLREEGAAEPDAEGERRNAHAWDVKLRGIQAQDRHQDKLGASWEKVSRAVDESEPVLKRDVQQAPGASKSEPAAREGTISSVARPVAAANGKWRSGARPVTPEVVGARAGASSPSIAPVIGVRSHPARPEASHPPRRDVGPAVRRPRGNATGPPARGSKDGDFVAAADALDAHGRGRGRCHGMKPTIARWINGFGSV